MYCFVCSAAASALSSEFCLVDISPQSDADILASDGEFAERLEFMLDTTISEMPSDFEPSDVYDADDAV